jgi:hypothetical protein
LARVDGKSPAEYVTLESSKDQVRRVARRFLKEPQQGLSQVAAVWAREIGSER